MPILCLSLPAPRGSDRTYPRRLAKEMGRRLAASGIPQVVARPDSDVCADTDFDLHLSLSVSKGGLPGGGARLSFDPACPKSRALARILAGRLEPLFPSTAQIHLSPCSPEEGRRLLRAPWAGVELLPDPAGPGPEALADALAEGMAECLGLPLLSPVPCPPLPVTGTRCGSELRLRPHSAAPLLARTSPVRPPQIRGRWRDWYLADFHGLLGYCRAEEETSASRPPTAP